MTRPGFSIGLSVAAKGVANVVIFVSDRAFSLRPGGLLFEMGERFSRHGAGEWRKE
jgi:hypothetical protein